MPSHLIPNHSMGGAPVQEGMQIATHPHFHEDGRFAFMHHTPLHMHVKVFDDETRHGQISIVFAENQPDVDIHGEPHVKPVVTHGFIASVN